MNNQKGFSLLGVMVAVFLISMGLVAILSLANYSLRAATLSKNKTTASFLAQEGIEAVRYIRESQSDWNAWYNSINSGSYRIRYNSGLFGFVDTPLLINSNGFYQYSSGAATPFYRRIILNKISANELSVSAEIKWQDRGKWHYLTAEDRLWNWK